MISWEGPTDDGESSPWTRQPYLKVTPSLHLNRRPQSNARGPEISTVLPYGDGWRLSNDKDAAK